MYASNVLNKFIFALFLLRMDTMTQQSSYFSVSDNQNFDLSGFQRNEDHPDRQLYFDHKTSKWYQEHFLIIPVDVYASELQIYEWRKQQDDHIIKVEHIQELGQRDGFIELKVFIEKINNLLEAATEFEWADGLGLLRSCFIGYQIIYNKFGLVTITDQMIGFDDVKSPKVWINFNFARNNSVYNSDTAFDKGTQNMMVKIVYRAIENHIKCHPLKAKLRNIIQSSETFAEAIDNIQKIQFKMNYTRSTKVSSSLSSRKYFSRTPEYKFEIDRKREEYTKMKYSQASENKGYKYCANQTSCLEFKQGVNRRQKQPEPSTFGRLENYLKMSTNKPQNLEQKSISPSKKINFTLNDTQKHERRYFGYRNSEFKNSSKSQSKSKAKESVITIGLSFKCQKKKRKNTMDSENGLQMVRKRTTTGFDLSPSPLSQNSEFKNFTDKQIAKSMVSGKLGSFSKTLKPKDCKESTNDFDCQNSLIEQTRPRKLSDASDLLHMRMIKQSIIQEKKGDQQQIKQTSLVRKLKNSIFNRIDDLKQSEIIMEQAEPSASDTKMSMQTTLQMSKRMLNISSKQMTQSINLHPKKCELAEPALVSLSSLDKFAKFKTDSRIQQTSKNSKAESVVPIKQNPQQQI